MVAGNNINEVQKIFDTTFYGDPIDVIMIAVAKSEDNLEYFSKPFPNQDNFRGGKAKDKIKLRIRFSSCLNMQQI